MKTFIWWRLYTFDWHANFYHTTRKGEPYHRKTEERSRIRGRYKSFQPKTVKTEFNKYVQGICDFYSKA